MESVKRFFFRMRESFWFLPVIYGLAAIFSIIFIKLLDTAIIHNWEKSIPAVFLTSADISKELYSALTTAILTMTTISFSTIMVVLTTYSTQFSPRTLQDFMRSKSTHHVLGVYTFGFLFALFNLLLVGKEDQFLRPVFMVITAICGLALFIYFIHMTSKQIRVNSLIEEIRKDGTRLICGTYKEKNYIEASSWKQSELERITREKRETIYAEEAGYVQNIDWKELFRWAEKEDVILESHVQAGGYILQQAPLISIIGLGEPTDKKKRLDKLLRFITIGSERSDVQDIEFMIEKIVEIALRAISPAVNDPHTAINCINRLGSLLVELGKHNKETRYLANKEDKLRVIRPTITFPKYLYRCFYQIKHYGREDVSVLYGLLDTLAKVAFVSESDIRRHIWNYHYEVLDVFDWQTLSNQDYLHMQEAYERLVEHCEKR
ncbi:DUF2254 domain-containing protein [Aciduricibacillus chroicocephali]|uniref:DUF2254 domain-containing protein n=1 Tax=Aciduricibacillus chroicocephali TaxID=3054939 RepID=A0ABY9KWA1_9BACI|nr:DUF2254 domain-containing protein [Bacillaceae bacterium 44XB]